MGGKLVGIFILILIIVIVHVVKAFFKWMGKALSGQGLPNQQVGLPGQQAPQQAGPPLEVRQFIEQARAQQQARSQPTAPPEVPRHTRVSPADEEELSHLSPGLSSRHLASSITPADEPAAAAPSQRRGQPRSRAKSGVVSLFKPDRKSLKQAMIWSEVLGKPVAMRHGQGQTVPFKDPFQNR